MKNKQCKILSIGNIRCTNCSYKIKNLLLKQEGVLDIAINIFLKQIKIEYLTDIISGYELIEILREGGYEINAEAKSTGLFFIILSLYLSQMISHYFFKRSIYLEFIYAAFLQIIFGINTMKNTSMNTEYYIMIGSYTSFVSGIIGMLFFIELEAYTFFRNSSMLILFILLGKLIEECVRTANNKFIQQQNNKPIKYKIINRSMNELSEEFIENIKIGDIIQINPYSYIPVDGSVINGESYVDESDLTGEAKPKLKTKRSRVYAGTINMKDVLLVAADKVGKETFVSEILKLLEYSQFEPVSKGFSFYFSRIILLLSITTFIIHYILGSYGIKPPLLYLSYSSPFLVAVRIGISVLVISCPCAYSISRPMAFLMASNNLFKEGIILKDVNCFKFTRNVNVIFFDKTGTLTTGNMKIVNVITPSYNKIFENIIYLLLSSLEYDSMHPIGISLYKHFKQDLIVAFDEKGTIDGVGIYGYIKRIYKYDIKIVNDKKGYAIKEDKHLFNCLQKDFKNEIRETIKTAKYKCSNPSNAIILYVIINNIVVTEIHLLDEIRTGAFELVKELQEMDIQSIILSGDIESNVKRVADSLGIIKVYFGKTAKDKRDIIEKYQELFGPVIMVGDGTNDTPALSVAKIGISFNTIYNVSNVSFITDNIKKIIYFIRLGKRVDRKIQINYFLSIIYNIIAIPGSIGLLIPFNIYFTPNIGCFCMLASSLSVIISSLLL
ncbi:Copper-exporting P-type ATPase [Astathelohania contejeani]|uniref:Copper-exporting P-type ATPase n=1 Tax=Astathelohania contejeani TaxID=164912 RepID=A0ABQ7I0R5_9MICR|nr:Copper-exporting P-type ATPase [Thelohania contejeani]